MIEEPTVVSKDEVPATVKDLCERVHSVSEGLSCLIFLPNADYSRLYPMVIMQDSKHAEAAKINAYLNGEKLTPPPSTLREKHELTLEAIHAAADYLPVIVFLPAVDALHPVNLVPETVVDPLKPCYKAVQQAQNEIIGTQPISVTG